jgi:hypothetical protein
MQKIRTKGGGVDCERNWKTMRERIITSLRMKCYFTLQGKEDRREHMVSYLKVLIKKDGQL